MLPSAALRHRLQLLRAWLLYFVSSVDNYIMECVLESSHIRLDMQLESAVHLGQIIDSHHDYVCSIHKQCLQQPSGAFLRDAINEVFFLKKLWTFVNCETFTILMQCCLYDRFSRFQWK
jgi:hypothetical protein